MSDALSNRCRLTLTAFLALASLALGSLAACSSTPADESPEGTWTAWTHRYDTYVTVSQTQSVRDLERPGEGSLDVVNRDGRIIASYRHFCGGILDRELGGVVSDSACMRYSGSGYIDIQSPDSLFAVWDLSSPPTLSISRLALAPAVEITPFVVTPDSFSVDSAPFFWYDSLRVTGSLVPVRRTLTAGREAHVVRTYGPGGYFRPYTIAFDAGGRFRQLNDVEPDSLGTWHPTGRDVVEARVGSKTTTYRFMVDRAAGRLTLTGEVNACDSECQKFYAAFLGVAPGTLVSVRIVATRTYRLVAREPSHPLPRRPLQPIN